MESGPGQWPGRKNAKPWSPSPTAAQLKEVIDLESDRKQDVVEIVTFLA